MFVLDVLFPTITVASFVIVTPDTSLTVTSNVTSPLAPGSTSAISHVIVPSVKTPPLLIEPSTIVVFVGILSVTLTTALELLLLTYVILYVNFCPASTTALSTMIVVPPLNTSFSLSL